MIKNLRFFYSALLLFLLGGCTVTESIVFNEDMSGAFMITYDLSMMQKMMKEMETQYPSEEQSKEKEIRKVMDTTIVFDEFIAHYKDSLATLSEEEQNKLFQLKGMTLHMLNDEVNEVMKFTMSREFNSVTELKILEEQLNNAMGVAMTMDNDSTTSVSGVGGETETKMATYTYKENIFKRHQPRKPGKKDENDSTGMEMAEMTKGSFYIINYTFPRKIKSVSNPDAVLSEDGKSFTLRLPLSAIDKDESLLDLEIILED